MGISDIFRNNKTSWLYFSLVFILPFIATSFIIKYVVLDNEANFITPTPWFLFGFYTLTCFTMAFALTHTTFVALLSGYFFGWSTAPYVVFSYLIASMLGYGMARLVDRGKIMKSVVELPKAGLIAEGLKNKELQVIILSRLSPVLPFAITNLLFAFLKADFRKFVLGGLLGMLPRTLLFIWTGTQAKGLMEALQKPEGLNLVQISTIMLVVISVFGLFYYVMGAVKRARRVS